MKIELSNKLLDGIELSKVDNIPPFNQPYFNLPSGEEPYKLLVHLTNQFNDVVISDLGTNRGASALALAQNKTNKIFSLDVVNVKENDIGMDNVEFVLGNFIENKEIQNKILGSRFIYLDIDHGYTNEMWLCNFLNSNKWNGFVICDDIHFFDPMRRFWNDVGNKKLDLTKYGHGAGTGCIWFGIDETEFCIV